MSNSTPEIPGYRFDQRLLQHPLAEVWHGRTFTGMEIVALVLSDAGARDATVRDRLVRAGRDAALEPEQLETPLWAANFSTDRPYAVTQLIPGQSGAERLIDPLDGVLGNDDESLQAVRAQLSQYGAMPPNLPPEYTAIPSYVDHPQTGPQSDHLQTGPQSDRQQTGPQSGWQSGPRSDAPHTGPQPGSAAPAGLTTPGGMTPGGTMPGGTTPGGTTPGGTMPGGVTSGGTTPGGTTPGGLTPGANAKRVSGAQSRIETAREYRRKIGAGIYVVVAVVVLIVFTVTYSVGAAVGSSVKDEPTEAAPPAAVTPSAYPTPVLLPAIAKITTAPYKRPDGSAGVFGATYAAGTDLQVVTNAELPFALGWPRPPQVAFLGESSSIVYRQILTRSEYSSGGMKNSLNARIALHPCASLAACLSDRAAFDQQWTKIEISPAPATAKDARTWLTVQTKSRYTVTMTRAFQSGGRWWLVGAKVTGAAGEDADVQRVINDIWRQTT